MKTITLINGKQINVEFGNNNSIKSLNSNFDLTKIKGEFVLHTYSASKEMANFFGADIEKKDTALRISESLYFELKNESENETKRRKEEEERKRKEYMTTRPQVKVLIFSGWYLTDTPKIVTLFEAEDGKEYKDKQNRWGISESHCELLEINISDALSLELREAQVSTDFESKCFLLSEEEINSVIKLNNDRITEKENIKLGNIRKELLRKNELIEKAKETGKKQIFSQYTDECDNSVPDCSFDQIITWIDSEGKTTTSRSHCH